MQSMWERHSEPSVCVKKSIGTPFAWDIAPSQQYDCETPHEVDWNSLQVVDQARRRTEHKVREASISISADP